MATVTATEINPGILTNIDLRDEAEDGTLSGRVIAAYRLTIWLSDTHAHADYAEAVLDEDNGRVGVAWGARAVWDDLHVGDAIEDTAERILGFAAE